LEKFGRRIDCELQVSRYPNCDWWICDEDGWCLYRSHGADLAEAMADAEDQRQALARDGWTTTG
jgi:hypothetical protein